MPRSAGDLAAWAEALNAEDSATLRHNSILWKAWRTLQAHRAATGHWQSVIPVPADAIANPN